MQEIYTSDQVAKILQIHPQTVLKFIREGRLMASKVGRGYRVKSSAIEEFLEETSRRPVEKQNKTKDTLKVEIDTNVSNTEKKDEEENNNNFPLEGGHYIIQ